MNEKIGTEKRRIIFFVAMLVIGTIAMIIYLSITGNTLQVYKDIVMGYTALDGSNKSAERTMFYIFSVAGALLYFVFYLKEGKQKRFDGDLTGENKKYSTSLYVVLAVLIFLVVDYFIYSRVNWLLFSAIALVLILNMIDVEAVVPGTAFLFICSYAVCALYRIYVFIGGEKPLSMMTAVLISLILSVALLAKEKENHKRFYLKGILILQVVVPFSFLYLLASKYKYAGEYLSIRVPYRVQILIGALISAYVVEAVNKIQKKWNSAENISDVVSSGTCVTIMAFNTYGGSGAIISSDLHHPFENIIGYSQIVELGQKTFTEYIPVSGMYSVIQGFFLSFFGHGRVSFYYLTENLFYLCIIILIVFLIRKQMKGGWLLFISLIFPVIRYNRVAFIVPVMILLAWPKLIEKKNLWLKAWFLTGFLHGLYYPVFGAAVCMGFLPLGIWQIVAYAKNGELRKDMKKASFWIGWIICCIPVILGFPILAGSAKHMMAMGGQTVYADGITRFGQTVPGFFFSYVRLLSTRLILYYVFSYLIVVSIVWVSVALCLKSGNVRFEDKRLKLEKPIPAFVSLSFGIALLVSCSYTVIRMDINSIYARSAGMIYTSFVMIILIVIRYMSDEKNRYIVFCFAVFIVAAVSAEGFTRMESDSKLEAFYTVPEGYVHVTDDRIDRLGECFADQEIYSAIEDAYYYTLNMDKKDSYLGVVGNFGLFYLCNLKGDSTMEIGTIKGFGAAQETVDLIRNNDTIVGTTISSINNYYLYHWLITSGEYIWQPETKVFVPNHDDVSREEILRENKSIYLAPKEADLGRAAGSWGSSMNTMNDIFSDVEIGYSVSPVDSGINIAFNKVIDGDDADFIYVEFADVEQNYQYMLFNHSEDIAQDIEEYSYIKSLMKKDYNRDIVVVVSWTDDYGNTHNMNCRLERGKLLVPLGSGRGWLLNNHSDITIAVMQGEKIIAVPDIVSFRLLKLQEVG